MPRIHVGLYYSDCFLRHVHYVNVHSFEFHLSLVRTCSKYTTVLITLERYLAVKHPCRSRSWFTIPRARTYCFIVLSSSLALGLPTALSFTVTKNPTYPQDESQFPFKFVATSMATRFSKILPLITLADFLLPLIALSTLNSLLFYEVIHFLKHILKLLLSQYGLDLTWFNFQPHIF